MMKRTGLVLVGAIVGLAGLASQGQWLVAARQSEGLAATIFPGTCIRPDEEPAFTLTELAKPTDEAVRGLPFTSETTIDTALPALQADAYSLVVSRDAGRRGDALACGDLNSVTTEDGTTMLVGLFEQENSKHSGIATFTADGEKTVVRVYVSRALSGGFSIGSSRDEEPTSDVSESVNVTVNDREIGISLTEFRRGSTVEFVVLNEGDERHEVILEERGALERPLSGPDGAQTETEDLAPKEEARFVYTFDETGVFQLADHIGRNYEDGLVTEITVVDG